MSFDEDLIVELKLNACKFPFDGKMYYMLVMIWLNDMTGYFRFIYAVKS